MSSPVRDILEQYGEQVHSFAPDYYPNIKKPILSLDQAESAINAYILGELMELLSVNDDPKTEPWTLHDYGFMSANARNNLRQELHNKANKKWGK
jgi:hypothetical protein